MDEGVGETAGVLVAGAGEEAALLEAAVAVAAVEVEAAVDEAAGAEDWVEVETKVESVVEPESVSVVEVDVPETEGAGADAGVVGAGADGGGVDAGVDAGIDITVGVVEAAEAQVPRVFVNSPSMRRTQYTYPVA